MTNERSLLPEALHPADPPGDPRPPLARLVTTLLLLKSLRILNCSEAGCLLEIKSSRKSPSGLEKDQREVETLHIFLVGRREKQLNCQIIFAGCSSKLAVLFQCHRASTDLVSVRLFCSKKRGLAIMRVIRMKHTQHLYIIITEQLTFSVGPRHARIKITLAYL